MAVGCRTACAFRPRAIAKDTPSVGTVFRCCLVGSSRRQCPPPDAPKDVKRKEDFIRFHLRKRHKGFSIDAKFNTARQLERQEIDKSPFPLLERCSGRLRICVLTITNAAGQVFETGEVVTQDGKPYSKVTEERGEDPERMTLALLEST